jgi:outer membrane protein OmpA-like peptidoglycan-associated protein
MPMDIARNREKILRVILLVVMGIAVGCSCSRPPGPVDPRPGGDAGVAEADGEAAASPADAAVEPEVEPADAAPPPPDVELAEIVQGTDEHPVRIFFDEDKSEVPLMAEALLGAVAERMRLRPSEVVRLVSHSDGQERRGGSLEIAGERAQAIVDWMAQHGVERERFIIDARGEFEPEGDPETPEGRAANRRVDFVFERGFGP